MKKNFRRLDWVVLFIVIDRRLGRRKELLFGFALNVDGSPFGAVGLVFSRVVFTPGRPMRGYISTFKA